MNNKMTRNKSGDFCTDTVVQVGLSALSLGMIFVGTCHEEVGSVLVQRLMESSDTELEQPMARLLSLGLGLLFIGKQDKADAMMEVQDTQYLSFFVPFWSVFLDVKSYSKSRREVVSGFAPRRGGLLLDVPRNRIVVLTRNANECTRFPRLPIAICFPLHSSS